MAKMLEGDDIDPIRAYQVQTDRLWRLSEFLIRFAPSVGERHVGGFEVPGRLLDDDSTDPQVLAESRDEAIEAAFVAVERIARLS